VKGGLDINPERWPDVSRVFAAAAALNGPARDAYLNGACVQDSGLRAAVESLLGAHDDAGAFGDGSVIAPSTVKRLSPDSQLGPFRIESFLGAGGMGEVYRAYDTKLQRAVAIKVLPDSFARDPNRLARFEEEARALAALNHPHVGAIYGLEESAGIAALVLELVEGPTLAERLAVGPLQFDEVVWITRQLAEGLEAAHERGIVHRDLKPANIKITPDGNVKILDFGLAKTAASPPGAALTPSTTSPRDATQFGVVLGTAGYMSPEQARGQAVDKRTDIWAFGCILFELCAHQPPFAGATISDRQAAVIEREPDWELLRAGTPANLVRLLRRCLTKDPKLRLRDIGEARIALEQDTDTAAVAPRWTTRRVAAIAAILATAAGFAIAFAIFGPPRSNRTAQPSPARFSVAPPDGGRFYRNNPGQSFLALSPDGSQLAFVASAESAPGPGAGRNRVWIRRLADLETRPVPGTDGATSVFWKPDSRSLAFFADGKLKRIDLPTGAAVPICDVEGLTHGTWGGDGVILMGEANGEAIHSVPAGGGTHREILARDRPRGEARVGWPWFLPDGKRFLYTARLDDGEGELRLGRLEGGAIEGDTRAVMRLSSNAQWVDPDIVAFAREGVLMGQRFDVETMRPIGEPFEIAERVEYFFTTSRAMFSTSRTGTVAYHPGGEMEQLVWADRNGNEVERVGSPAEYNAESTRLSRDGTQLLTARSRPGVGTYDIWRRDLGRGTEEQLTFRRGSEITPVFIEGERAIVYAADSTGRVPHLFRMDLATRIEEQVLPPGSQHRVMDVFPDGRVAYLVRSGNAPFQLFQLSLTRGASPAPLLQSPLIPGVTRLSRDGRAMTYAAFGEGNRRVGVYVAKVPVTGPVTDEPVLAVGGDSVGVPRWSADGRQLYYVSPDDAMMTISVQTIPKIKVGDPKQLFKARRSATLLEVANDGRFLLLVRLVRADQRPIVVATAAIGSNP
jgi:Tol biopolymer transport system component